MKPAGSRSTLVLSVCITCVTVSTLVVSLRLYTRLVLLKTPGLDDLTIVIVQALYIVILTYSLAMNILKCSFLLHYRRIFPGVTIRRVCLFFLIFVILWAIVHDIILGLACVPLSFINPSMADKCLDTVPAWYSVTIVHIITDFIIFLIPLPVILSLNLRLKQKILLATIFSLGFFTCTISVIRAPTLRDAAVTEDLPWGNTDAAWWTVLELTCGILCASLPTLRPLLAKVVPGLSTKRSSNDHELYATGRRATTTGFMPARHSASGGSTEALGVITSADFDAGDDRLFIDRPDPIARVYTCISGCTKTGEECLKTGFKESGRSNQKGILLRTELTHCHEDRFC
ncbi:hypothetical protein EDB81DRAFT_650699 [Dactylonectria macrodidyma]|uniref:Rhodopsin domain-containing protein n=1 Tax=Dactylonectria macrodidyma TaxID=307937 RepID=A0A9P9J7F0_9HYPO|nr:hypothetical protein EDB81DRAFT_650699 [Dactylonectria macrodidyma]